MFTLDDAFELCELSPLVRAQLQRTYSQDFRKYHNLRHLENMLRWIPEAKVELKDYELPILVNAILFHDIVYLPKPVAPGYNEALSAAEYIIQEYWIKTPFADGQLYPRLGSTIFEAMVIEGINATAHHAKTQEHLHATSQWLLDFDLQSFAQDWDEYENDNKAVQEELKLIKAPDRQHEFLTSLMNRPKIYYKMTKWEEKARANIQHRLDLLEGFI